MSDATHTNELDWDNLANPIPMNLLDSDFADASDEIKAHSVEVVETEELVEAPKLDMRSQIEAQMEAETIADQEAQAKADEEEASQRQRLEQWMANARTRLQAADEEPQIPGAPARVKKDPSPTLIRRTEMQRTLGDAEEAEAMLGLESSSGYKTGKISLDGTDPMATIIVPRETYVASEDSRTQKLKALERKVSEIKQMEAGAETMIMAARTLAPKKSNTKMAVWVLGGLIPITLALGLFALARTGYLENLGDIFPSLFSHPIANTPVVTSNLNVAKVQAPPVVAKVAPTPLTPIKPPVKLTPVKMVVPAQTALKPKLVSVKSLPVKAVSAKPAKAPPTKLSALEMANQALAKTRKNSEASMAGISSQTTPAKIVQSEPVANPPAPTLDSPTDQPSTNQLVAQVTLPSAAKVIGRAADPSSTGSAKGEAALKASVQAALNRDRESLQSIYDRFAMGTPGLVGGLVVGLTVDPSGHILNGVITASSTGTPGFDQELLNKVMEWKLGAFPDKQSRYISVPIHFEPKAE